MPIEAGSIWLWTAEVTKWRQFRIGRSLIGAVYRVSLSVPFFLKGRGLAKFVE